MKNVAEYIDSLTTEQLVEAYEKEYLVFKKTGVCPDGVIRTIARLTQKVIGDYDIRFAERMFLERCAELFYEQNKN